MHDGPAHLTFAQVLLSILLGFCLCWSLVPLIARLSKRHVRRQGVGQFHHTHKTPISRLGGLALAATFLALAGTISLGAAPGPVPLPLRLAIVLGALAMFGLGMWDDLRPLGAKIKLLGQFAVASGLYVAGVKIELLQSPFTQNVIELGLLSYPATVLWLVILTNLINLIDGIDGLAAGVGFMLMCLIAHMGAGMEMTFTTLLASGMAAALLAFTYYNFPPAKIYMGDGGAYLLGFLIGVLSLVESQKGSVAAALIAPLIALALPITDASLAVVRRGLKGLPVFRPDRDHIHHVLLRFGFSRERTLLILYAVSVAALCLAFGVFWSQGRLLPLLFGFLFLLGIVTVRAGGFTAGWFAVRQRLTQSLLLRTETRYALILSQWLEMESERCASIQQLWDSFQFVVRKLGFSEVQLQMVDGLKIWRTDVVSDPPAQLHRIGHEINGYGRIELAADPQVLRESLFELLSELAAETWHKAALRWQKLNGIPVQFCAVASPETSPFQRKRTRPYAPDAEPLWGHSRRLNISST